MLFHFPQEKYADGTYIRKNGISSRLTNYQMTPLKFIEKNGYRFSCGWKLTMPGIKAEHYEIIPIMEGQLNLAYFEQLCYIYDENGREAGMCFVELLPGVYNQKIDGKLLLKNF